MPDSASSQTEYAAGGGEPEPPGSVPFKNSSKSVYPSASRSEEESEVDPRDKLPKCVLSQVSDMPSWSESG